MAGFVLVPTAPPRLLPGGTIPDALYTFRAWGWWGGEASVPSFVPRGFANQFAAMPSLHFGWALWCGVLIWRHASHRWVRWFGALYPPLIAAVVLSTGNHYLVDIVGGAAAMSVGLAVVWRDQDGLTRSDVVLDVRRDDEYRAGHVAGAAHVPIHEVLARVDEIPRATLWVHCASGLRATIASSLLERAGRHVVVIDDDFEHAEQAGWPLAVD